MELIDYLRLLARRWLYVVALTLLGFAAAAYYLHSATRTYESSAQVFVANQRTATTTANQTASANKYTLSRMPTYAALLDSVSVLQQVQAAGGKGLTIGQLSSRLSAKQVGKTVLLKVTATDTDRRRAATVANSAATVLSTAVVQLEQPTGGAPAPITVTTTRPATASSQPISPRRNLALAGGLVGGLVLGLMAAALRDQAASRPRGASRRSGPAGEDARQPSDEDARQPSDDQVAPPAPADPELLRQ